MRSPADRFQSGWSKNQIYLLCVLGVSIIVFIIFQSGTSNVHEQRNLSLKHIQIKRNYDINPEEIDDPDAIQLYSHESESSEGEAAEVTALKRKETRTNRLNEKMKSSRTETTSSNQKQSKSSKPSKVPKSKKQSAPMKEEKKPYDHPLKKVPAWVLKYNVSHLFDWTWLKNGEYEKHVEKLKTLQANKSYQPSGVVVNDAIEHLKSHPDQGVLVDVFDQLPNPVPHPLPINPDFNAACDKMNIRREWLACKLSATELSTAMPYTRKFVNVAIYNGFIDGGSCHPVVPGTIFNNAATYHFQKWTNNACNNDPIRSANNIQEFDEIASSVGTYTNAFGHYPNQQLPRLLRMLATVPETTKILTAGGRGADPFIDIMIERGIITPDRVVRFQGGTTYFGKVVYRSEAWPYLSGEKYGNYLHDRTDMQLMHRTFIDTVPREQRNLIVFIKRLDSRQLTNIDAIISKVNAAKPAHLQVELFTAGGHLRDHMKMFSRARVVIAPHGAGLINVMWCEPGTHVVEIGYEHGMTLPSMYYEMSSHADLTYWLGTGSGAYDGTITSKIDEWDWALPKMFDMIRQEDEEAARREASS